jgi:hypothetical protein
MESRHMAFPFKTVPSFAPLAALWRQIGPQGASGGGENKPLILVISMG